MLRTFAVLALLALGACNIVGRHDTPAIGSQSVSAQSGAELAPIGESTTSPDPVDGGLAFADRETFQRFCPLHSAALSQHFGVPFRPVLVYLAPPQPDAAPPEQRARDLAVCRYESADAEWQFAATYIRESPADRAQRMHQDFAEQWAAHLVAKEDGAPEDHALMLYQDFPGGGYLSIRFPVGDVTVEYLLFGATLQEGRDAIRDLPRPNPPSL